MTGSPSTPGAVTPEGPTRPKPRPLISAERLGIIAALLIALATVANTLLQWQITQTIDESAGAEAGGSDAVLYDTRTRVVSVVNAYEHSRAYLDWLRHSEYANALWTDVNDLESRWDTLTEDERRQYEVLANEMKDAQDLAFAGRHMFSGRYLTRDGNYSVEREMSEALVDAARKQDLDPDPYFARADALADRSSQMLLALSGLGMALVFFTLVDSAGERLKYVMLLLGVLGLAAVGGMVWLVQTGQFAVWVRALIGS